MSPVIHLKLCVFQNFILENLFIRNFACDLLRQTETTRQVAVSTTLEATIFTSRN